MALDDRKGVWKSGKGKGRHTPKGRQVEDDAWDQVKALLGDQPRRSDLLIEFMHLIQDAYGCLSAAHLRALAEELRMSQAEVYEVATFYAHFDVVKEGAPAPPALTIRVCDSLSCELAGAQALQKALEDGLDAGAVRVLRAPCMGRCDTAPVLEIGHNHIDHATVAKVEAAIAADDTHAHVPDYEVYEDYVKSGGYAALLRLRDGGDWELCKSRFLHLGCADWAVRVFHRVKSGALCVAMRDHGIWLSTGTRASLGRLKTAIIWNARRICFWKVC